MRGRTSLIVLATLVVGIAAGIFLRSSGIVGPRVRQAPALAAPITPEGMNGLSPSERGTFYHLSEGGELFPLDWFLALEVESVGQDGSLQVRPFMDNFERYGFLPDPKSSGNPYGLPVGISFGRSKISGWPMIGLNCTACHVGQFQYGNRAVRIDGGPNMVLVNQMLADMATETDQTLKSPRRLLRFWSRVREIRRARRALIAQDGDDVLGPDESMMSRVMEMLTQNRGLLASRLSTLRAVPILAKSLNISVKEGYGRLDAFGVGRDEFFGGIPENMLPADAPVSLPHIWGLMYTGWLQWGANTNSVMERNIGQALGVGALFDRKTYSSTVRIDNLKRMEDFAYRLQPPKWPDFFPPIDRGRAARGEKLFTQYCAPCHETWDQDGLMRSYKLHALAEVGTDPLTAIGFERPVILPDGTVTPFAYASVEPITKVKEKAYAEMKLDAMQIAALEQRQIRKGPQWDPTFRATLLDSEKWADSRGRKVYRSKTLVGIWATPPFLHNGSVPTLYHLLKPAAERPVTFFTGQRDYDPVKLGLELDRTKFNLPPGLDLFTFDTRISGNWNTGHEWSFYPSLNDEMRFDIIEYVKTFTKEFDAPPRATAQALAAAGVTADRDVVFTAAAAAPTNWMPFMVVSLLGLGAVTLLVRSVSANAAKHSASEPADIQKIRDGILALQARLATDQDRPLRRGTHAKGRCVSATFEVFDVAKTISDSVLAARLAQGLFAQPGVYRATVRFANGNSQIQRDKKGDVRACSFAVELPGGGRQDFSMNNATIFPINDAHAFAVAIQVATASSVPKGFWSLKLGDKMAFVRILALAAFQTRPPKVPYQLTRYWSNVPFCHGPADAMKYSAIPCSGNLAHPLDGTANELQDELVRHVTHDDHMSAFDFGIQLLDTTKMRHWLRRRDASYWIENGSIEWKESQSPFHVVGRLTLVRGSVFSEEACEAQYIDVTEHSTPSSAPLGSLNRARWAAESASRKARAGQQ